MMHSAANGANFDSIFDHPRIFTCRSMMGNLALVQSVIETKGQIEWQYILRALSTPGSWPTTTNYMARILVRQLRQAMRHLLMLSWVAQKRQRR